MDWSWRGCEEKNLCPSWQSNAGLPAHSRWVNSKHVKRCESHQCDLRYRPRSYSSGFQDENFDSVTACVLMRETSMEFDKYGWFFGLAFVRPCLTIASLSLTSVTCYNSCTPRRSKQKCVKIPEFSTVVSEISRTAMRNRTLCLIILTPW